MGNDAGRRWWILVVLCLVNDTTREVGGTLGVTIIGSVLNSAYTSHVLTALTRLGTPAAAARSPLIP